MQIRIFNIHIGDDIENEDNFNKFLRSHRVLEVKQQYDETRGLWTFAVNYIDGERTESNNSFKRNDKIDYREVLSPEKFVIFAALREQRKIIAKDEGIPAYAVFTDKELSSMAEMEDLTPANIIKIEGINKGRTDKYGERLINGYYQNK